MQSTPLLPDHWHAATLTTHDIRLHYYRTGGRKPPLILLHGFTVSGISWLRVARALEHDFDIIMPDARGHGHSDGPEHGFSLSLLTDDVATLIHTLGLERPILLGHSMGAAISARLAATTPHLVHAIVLEELPLYPFPTPQLDEHGDYPAWYTAWLAAMQSLKTSARADRSALAAALLPPSASRWSEEDRVSLIDAMAQFNLGTIAHTTPDIFLIDWRDMLPRITCPLLLLTGSPEHGTRADPADIQQMAAFWQHGQYIAFAEAGHLIHRDTFEHYIQVVKTFITERL